MARLTPFEPGEKEIDYEKLIKEFGTKPISGIKNLPDLKAFRKGIVFSHRDFDKYLDAIKKKKKVSILTGFNASGSIHLGHKRTFDVVIDLQKKYKIPVYIPISDDESYVFRKIKDQKEGLKNAKLIAKQMIALGFDRKITKIFIHQQYTKIYNLAIKLSRPTLSEVKAIYGFNDSTNTGAMFYPIIQAADILLPQELLGKHHTVVPIGIDQDPHVRLSRDIAEKFGYIKPSTIHTKYLPGLRGGKMSVSIPGSTIFLNDNPEKAAKKIMNALTGGRETVEEQRKLGGRPDKCVVFDYHEMFLNEKELEKIKKDCLAGKLMCGQCKKILAKNVKKYLKGFQARVKKVKIEKYLIRD
ncbi:MAG: tryptophan--tRNA ligase [Candidatus Aenigmatarchaeota archaeon]